MTATKKINANGMKISVLRLRSTIEYLGVWEQLHNPRFNPIEFDGFRQQAGLNAEHRFKKLTNNNRMTD